MNNDIYSFDFMRALPDVLKNDPDMNALAKIIAEELMKTAGQIKNNVIYADIQSLDEKTLDILAYDLHVDWYDYSYPIEAKRALIKDSVKVHRKLGTKYAVETALGNLHPNSFIEEWFQYNGQPYYFRIVLDTTHSRVPASTEKVRNTINIYKRLAAHMDGLIYQCQIVLLAQCNGHGFKYKVSATGENIAGTVPQRNTKSGVVKTTLRAQTKADAFSYSNPIAGTIPQTATAAEITKSAFLTSTTTDCFHYCVKRCGTTLCK